MMMAPVLVSADWLGNNIDNVRLFDASTHLPTVKRDAEAEFLAGHIPGARRFDIDAIADKGHAMPHMVPAPGFFAECLAALGVSDDDHVVFYDDSDVKTAARGWWMMRLFGHGNVSILDGGLAAWKAAGGGLRTGQPAAAEPGSFSVRPAIGVDVVDIDRLAASVAKGRAGQIVDARAAARFAGEAPEPRPGLRAGHIPGSFNLPFNKLLDNDGSYHDAATIRQLFVDAGVDPEAPVTTSCGSGITACVLAAGLALAGNDDVTVYDGSWTEWGSSDEPIETGPAPA
ncbi:MAG: 3-mercaptopyruvate sulfurtransferase [Pseudomonadota bacterium]|nr:3-mercaptopyruvate sulfurtransferase [Pseudomonadota bacterium]